MKWSLHSMLLTGLFSLSMVSVQAEQSWEALPDKPPIPKDNPQSEAKVKLGKILFFDPRLSKTGTVSCNSCHNVMAGGDDNRPTSFGIEGKQGGRSAPTVWNAAFLTVQFWDGRAVSLEEQAKGPVTNPVEMGMKDWDTVVALLKSIPEYEPLFKAAFSDSKDPINADNAVKAIAAYERTLITPHSPFDRYVKGDKKALNEQQIRGMQTFTETGCPACHLGPTFSGKAEMGTGFFMKFPLIAGSPYDAKYKLLEDSGRHQVTQKEEDKNMWRVPTLRNVALTAPYFHNGAVKTLDEAVRVMAKVQLGKDLKDEQVKDIVSFLEGLTGEFPKQELPRLPGTPGKTVISNE